MSEQLEVVDCPDPSVHGSPFRYCPYCKWMEEPEPVEPSFEVQMLRVAIEALKAERDDLAAQLAQWNEWLSEHGGLDVPEAVLDTYHLELERRVDHLTRERDELQERVDAAVGEFGWYEESQRRRREYVVSVEWLDYLLAILQPKLDHDVR